PAARPPKTPDAHISGQMPGRSPAPTGRRRRRSRGWSTPCKASRRPQSPTPSSAPPPAQQPPLPPGTEVEVRVDDDGFHGSWFEAKVDSFLPARGRGSRARYTVTYSHLLSDDSGGTLVEPFAPSHIRPRPPPPSNPEPLCLHDIVEAFHNDGWWSGILLATDPLTAAFPITREVITFQDPHHVRPRRDYVDGQWLPSKVAISVQPKRAVRVYAVGDKVEVVRDRDLYGYSWFPATVAKVIDRLSYLVEYSDLEEEAGGGKAMEYLHCLFIRPDVEHSPRESEFRLGPGAAVEVYCDGAWSPGVVQRAVGEGEYEVSIDGKEGELLLKKVPELLKPQYKWNGKHWRIVSPKRQGNRRQSVSGKRPSSAVEVASNDDENSHHTQSPATKRSRKELPRKKLEELTESSEHVLESEMDTSLSALRKSLASNFSPKTCSPRSRKNNFQAISRRIVDSCTVPMKGLAVYHASSENPAPQNESRADGFRKQKMDSNCINNAIQKPQESPLDVQPLQVKKFSAKHKGGEKGGETHPIQALEGNSDTFDNIQLKGNSNSSCKEIICALTASTCNAPSPLDKQTRAPDAVSRGADSSSNTKVFASKKSAEKKGFKGLSSPHSSGHGARTVQKRSAKKVAGRQKECFVERQVDSRGPHTQQQLNREEKVNVNDGTNQELFPLIPPGFKSICNGQGFTTPRLQINL
uniref:Agenet domain-containing protein n=1 Tax=Aegilops tauschii subsp. strangulata TaxID=200361 RepID=A0A453I0I8_AEGTS